MKEDIEQEILFLREQIKTLLRIDNAIKRQILHLEARIDDLRKVMWS